MKTIEAARSQVVRWLGNNFLDRVAVGELAGGVVYEVVLGDPSQQTLVNDWSTVWQWKEAWWRTSLPAGARLVPRTRIVARLGANGPKHDLPTHLAFDSLDAAAAFAEGTWSADLAQCRARWQALTLAFPQTATRAVLSATRNWEQVDFELLLSTSAWFRVTPRNQWEDLLTPRQVPVPGIHAKWLDAQGRRVQVARLAGLERLSLAQRPTRIHFSYADPQHLYAGERSHDSYTLTDTAAPAYSPQVVLICENKDTVVTFGGSHQIPGLLLVEGNGDAAYKLLPEVPWIVAAPRVVYWGDLDAEGFQILSRLRVRLRKSNGACVESILMDPATFTQFLEFGTKIDRSGKPLERREWDPMVAEGLTDIERETYRIVTDPDWLGFRRVEQELIPLDLAVDELQVTGEGL